MIGLLEEPIGIVAVGIGAGGAAGSKDLFDEVLVAIGELVTLGFGGNEVRGPFPKLVAFGAERVPLVVQSVCRWCSG